MPSDFKRIAAEVGLSSIAGGLAGHHLGTELSFVKRVAERVNTRPSNVAGIVFSAVASAGVCAIIGVRHTLKAKLDKELSEIATQITEYQR